MFFFSFNFALAQSPGGVADDLELWLSADKGVTLVGSEVSTWNDQSRNGKHFSNTAGTTAGTRPEFVSNSFNSNPSILFNEGVTSDYLGVADFSGYSSGELTQFIVFKNPSNSFKIG